MIYQFSKIERYAIVSILSQIMNADGIIHPNEERFMNNIYREFEITISDIDKISNLNEFETQDTIIFMSPIKKEYALKLFTSMAESDGYIHPNELDIINNFFNNTLPFY